MPQGVLRTCQHCRQPFRVLSDRSTQKNCSERCGGHMKAKRRRERQAARLAHVTARFSADAYQRWLRTVNAANAANAVNAAPSHP